jgi:hypothetical protein
MPSVTLTTTAPIATRVLAALGKTLGLIDGQGQGRSATQQEYSDWLRDVTKRMVQGQELQDAHAAIASPADVPIT